MVRLLILWVFILITSCSLEEQESCCFMTKSSEGEIFINYLKESDYLFIGRNRNGSLAGRFIEIFNLSDRRPDTAFGYIYPMGNFEKRLSFFNSSNVMISLVPNIRGYIPEMVQLEEGVPTEQSTFVWISKKSGEYCFTPIIGQRIDSVSLNWKDHLIASSKGDELCWTEDEFIDSLKQHFFELKVWTKKSRDSLFYLEYVSFALDYSRVVRYNSIEEVPDSIRLAQFDCFLDPKLQSHIRKKLRKFILH